MSPWWRYLSKVKPSAVTRPAPTVPVVQPQSTQMRAYPRPLIPRMPVAGCAERDPHGRMRNSIGEAIYARRVAGRLWPSLGADCAAARSAAMAAARLRWRRRPAAMIAAACAWVWLRALHRPLAVDRRDLSEHDALRRRRRADHVQPVRRPRLPDVPTSAQALQPEPVRHAVAQCARAHWLPEGSRNSRPERAASLICRSCGRRSAATRDMSGIAGAATTCRRWVMRRAAYYGERSLSPIARVHATDRRSAVGRNGAARRLHRYRRVLRCCACHTRLL